MVCLAVMMMSDECASVQFDTVGLQRQQIYFFDTCCLSFSGMRACRMQVSSSRFNVINIPHSSWRRSFVKRKSSHHTSQMFEKSIDVIIINGNVAIYRLVRSHYINIIQFGSYEYSGLRRNRLG